MLSQNQIALLINSFSQLTTNTNYVTTIRITASYKTTQSFNYQGNTVKPLIDLYSGNTVVILQDTSTRLFYAIREDFNPVLNERTFTRKYREEEKKLPSREEADVAVLLSCEKEDAYDFWITWLGDRRKNRFAYVGELPKRLQTEQYWAWEGQGFEFNPYAGATGGGLSATTTPNNYDGAVVDAGPEGAYYQSEGHTTGANSTPIGQIEEVGDIPAGDVGGIVTPRWSRVLTDYSVTARTYLQTLCSPIGMYTDVSWEWSDGGEGEESYRFQKVPGDGVTTKSQEDLVGTVWRVNWSYDGGGGSVSVAQTPAPRVEETSRRPEDGPLYRLVTESGQEFISSTPFTIQRATRTKPNLAGVSAFYRFCFGDWPVPMSDPLPSAPYSTGLGGDWRASYEKNGVYADRTIADGQPFRIANYPGCGFNVDASSTYSSPSASLVFIKDDQPFDPMEYLLEVFTNGTLVYSSGWILEPEPNPFQETLPPVDDPIYTIEIFDEDNIQVGADSASSPISSNTVKLETKRVSFYINKTGETPATFPGGNNPGGFEEGDEVPADYRFFEDLEDRETVASVSSETRLVIARIDAWVEVSGKKLATVTINGREGQAILDSSSYAEATKPYKDSNGKTIYPCFPQKSDYPPKEEKQEFNAEDGFNAYHVTWYNPREESLEGNITGHQPVDLDNPDFQVVPPPSINYLYSLISTDLWVNYEAEGFLSWGKDIPEENTRLEEEKESGVDKYGVVYALVKGFVYALYGPTKVSQSTTSAVISKKDGQTLLGNYDFTLFSFRNRMRKPRLYVLDADKSDEGRPFEENDIQDPDQRGLSLLPLTMSQTFRQQLWGYSLSPIGNENNEDWATERVTFERNPSGGDTPFERQYLNDETANSSTVKQRGDNTVDITVNIADVRALLKKTDRGNVEFTIHDSQRPSETTIKTFKMNPIQDVFEGYSDVKILAVAGVIY